MNRQEQGPTEKVFNMTSSTGESTTVDFDILIGQPIENKRCSKNIHLLVFPHPHFDGLTQEVVNLVGELRKYLQWRTISRLSILSSTWNVGQSPQSRRKYATQAISLRLRPYQDHSQWTLSRVCSVLGQFKISSNCYFCHLYLPRARLLGWDTHNRVNKQQAKIKLIKHCHHFISSLSLCRIRCLPCPFIMATDLTVCGAIIDAKDRDSRISTAFISPDELVADIGSKLLSAATSLKEKGEGTRYKVVLHKLDTPMTTSEWDETQSRGAPYPYRVSPLDDGKKISFYLDEQYLRCNVSRLLLVGVKTITKYDFQKLHKGL